MDSAKQPASKTAKHYFFIISYFKKQTSRGSFEHLDVFHHEPPANLQNGLVGEEALQEGAGVVTKGEGGEELI